MPRTNDGMPIPVVINGFATRYSPDPEADAEWNFFDEYLYQTGPYIEKPDWAL